MGGVWAAVPEILTVLGRHAYHDDIWSLSEKLKLRTQAPVVRQKLVPLQNLPSARGCKFPFVICNEEKEGRREERVWHHRGEGGVHDPLPHLRLIALDAGRYRSPVVRVNLPVTSCPSGLVSSYTSYVHKCLVLCYRCLPHHPPPYASQVHLC